MLYNTGTHRSLAHDSRVFGGLQNLLQADLWHVHVFLGKTETVAIIVLQMSRPSLHSCRGSSFGGAHGGQAWTSAGGN